MSCSRASDSPLIAVGKGSHAALDYVAKLPVLMAVTEATAAEFDNHIDIVSRNIATADITKIFIFSEIRTDIFRHF